MRAIKVIKMCYSAHFITIYIVCQYNQLVLFSSFALFAGFFSFACFRFFLGF